MSGTATPDKGAIDTIFALWRGNLNVKHMSDTRLREFVVDTVLDDLRGDGYLVKHHNPVSGDFVVEQIAGQYSDRVSFTIWADYVAPYLNSIEISREELEGLL